LTENISQFGLDTFLVSQVYAIIVLPNGGPDLEAYKFVNASKMGWRQASSLFWQVAKALAHAEQLVSFEVHILYDRQFDS
jgi:serine/threonine-protein kinase haspin